MVCSKENWVRGKLLKPNPPFVFTLQNFLWTLLFDESSKLKVFKLQEKEYPFFTKGHSPEKEKSSILA